MIVVDDGVESLCVNPASSVRGVGGRWQDCETAAVETIAREHGGYLGSGIEGSDGSPERHFLREGRAATIELEAETALRRRQEAIAAFPVQQPEPPGADPFEESTDLRGDDDFLAVLRDVSARIHGDPEAAFDLAAPQGPGGGWLPESPQEYVSELFNAVMHQDSCYPHTAEAVPLVAALATEERFSVSVRAQFYGMLWAGGSNADRLIAYFADKFVADGVGFEVPDGPRLTRDAVQAVVGELFGRWGREPGAIRKMLAGLAATFPAEAEAAGIILGLTEFAERWAGTYRGAALRLALAAARADDADTLEQLAEIQAWHWQGPLAGGSPLAPARARALYLLDEILDAD
ncbi:MAG TPA: hypothetical protein VL551_07855 [Actinospica sp.]|nr:hypothetical protein [Actinospica sp.]